MHPHPILRRGIALLVPVLLAACARPAAPLAVHDVAGCWTLQWLDADTLIRPGLMPDSVRLDTVIEGRADLDQRRVGFAGRSVPSDTLGPGDDLPWYREFAVSRWEMGTGDTIRIVFNNNWTRYETEVRVRGDRLAGTATFRSDYEPVPPPTLAVRGERFPCPAAAP